MRLLPCPKCNKRPKVIRPESYYGMSQLGCTHFKTLHCRTAEACWNNMMKLNGRGLWDYPQMNRLLVK